jgi:uncharacterized protein (DUF1330 family)
MEDQMVAYLIADIHVIDAAGYEEYRQKVPRSQTN